jgi:hypothetical protein
MPQAVHTSGLPLHAPLAWQTREAVPLLGVNPALQAYVTALLKTMIDVELTVPLAGAERAGQVAMLQTGAAVLQSPLARHCVVAEPTRLYPKLQEYVAVCENSAPAADTAPLTGAVSPPQVTMTQVGALVAQPVAVHWIVAVPCSL